MTALMLCLLAGYSLAQKVNVEFDQAADFSKYKTFAIRNGQVSSQSPILNSELVRKQIESDIEQNLTARGLTRVDGPADLNVMYHLGSAHGVQREVYPARWWGTRVVAVPYSEGTLVIDLRDTSTHSLVWRGIASAEKSDPAKIKSKLDDMVRKPLEKYPPKKK